MLPIGLRCATINPSKTRYEPVTDSILAGQSKPAKGCQLREQLRENRTGK